MRYSLRVRFELLSELMDEADEKGTGPLRFGIAGRVINFHGRHPLVKVMCQLTTIFRRISPPNPNKSPEFVPDRGDGFASPGFQTSPDLIEAALNRLPYALLCHDPPEFFVDAAGCRVFLR